MTLRRSDIVARLQTLIQAQAEVFPAGIDIDASDLGEFTALDGGLSHTGNLVSGRFEPTIDAGPAEEWEGVRGLTFSYAIAGVDQAARVARRDLAVPTLAAMLAADRTLGLDPQVWAELGQTIEDDDAPVADAASVSVAHVDINVTYVAATAAG